MRLIDADELLEHVWRDKLDSRELIAKMIDNAPTVEEISTKIPIDVFRRLISQGQCKMTAEEYRQRMMQAFSNANAEELIAVCVLPTEKEFQHLEWLLKKHYKADKEYEAKVITRGKCMMCGKELDEGLFFCKECEAKVESEE